MAKLAQRQTHVNAYAADAGSLNPVNAPSGGDPRFVTPNIDRDSPYLDVTDNQWSPDVQDVIDPTRLGGLRHDRRADLKNPTSWWDRLNFSQNKRHEVETVDADGWTELQRQRHFAPDPRWTPPTEMRPTAMMSPSRWRFMRPFGQSFTRYFDGTHFSFADNKRNYDLFGMRPASMGRNTYRTEPKPWDTDIVDDMGDPNANLPYAHYESTTSNIIGQRAYRLES